MRVDILLINGFACCSASLLALTNVVPFCRDLFLHESTSSRFPDVLVVCCVQYDSSDFRAVITVIQVSVEHSNSIVTVTALGSYFCTVIDGELGSHYHPVEHPTFLPREPNRQHHRRRYQSGNTGKDNRPGRNNFTRQSNVASFGVLLSVYHTKGFKAVPCFLNTELCFSVSSCRNH